MRKLLVDFNMIQYLSFVLFLLSFLYASLGVSTPLLGQTKYTVDPSIKKDPTGYKLRSGDSIRIIVQGEPDATIATTLNNYGRAKPAYISELKLSGLNVNQAEAQIIKQ